MKRYTYIYWSKYTRAHTTTAFGRFLDQAMENSLVIPPSQN